jgi:TrkA domain protein
MTNVEETVLPGVGIRYDFTTSNGARVGVLHRRTGRRELLLYDRDDPDTCTDLLRLEDDDSRTLAELLGGSTVAEHLRTLQRIEGLGIDWLTVAPGSPYAGRTIGDTQARSRTGTSIVAVLRDEEAFPAPDPSFRFEPGDVAVVVGTPRGIEQLAVLLRTG